MSKKCTFWEILNTSQCNRTCSHSTGRTLCQRRLQEQNRPFQQSVAEQAIFHFFKNNFCFSCIMRAKKRKIVISSYLRVRTWNCFIRMAGCCQTQTSVNARKNRRQYLFFTQKCQLVMYVLLTHMKIYLTVEIYLKPV